MGVQEKHPKLRLVGNECPRTKSVVKTFASYFDGEISERAMDDIERHILKCDSCRKVFLEFTAKLFGKRPPIHSYLASLTAFRQGPSNSFGGNLASLKAEDENSSKEDDFLTPAARSKGQNPMSSDRLLMNKAV